MRSSFYFIICLMALPVVLPGCGKDPLPPYTDNGGEDPPVYVVDTAAFVKGLEGRWQLVREELSTGAEPVCFDFCDSAIFYVFTIDEYTYSGKPHEDYCLRQKGTLTIRRNTLAEAPIPFEYAYMEMIWEEDADYDSVANLMLGHSAFRCSLGYDEMVFHLNEVKPETGTRRFSGRSWVFDKVE
jgi:hypothetical protein